MHDHNQPTYYANGKLVCDGCITDEDKGGNECFCTCHIKGNLVCPLAGLASCERYHRVQGENLNG